MRDCPHESFYSGIRFFAPMGANAPRYRSGGRVYLHVYRVPTELFRKHGEFAAETLAVKRQIGALAGIARETMAAIL